MSKSIKLSDYVETRINKIDAFSTSVSISETQRKFIKDNGINLSALVRDILNKLIEEKQESGHDKNKTA